MRVDTLPPQVTGAHPATLVAEGLVVASPQAWSRLPDYALIEQSAGTVVRLVEREI